MQRSAAPRSPRWLVTAVSLVLIAVAASAFAEILHAETFVPSANISADQGLSQNTVQAILQDHVGFLWFATEEGLNRYDGHSFVVFKRKAKTPGSLSDNVVLALYEDREGRLWVGTTAGLDLFDRRTETFSLVLPTRGRPVCSILEDADGTLWVATQGQGLFRRDARTAAFTSYTHDANDPTSLASNWLYKILRDRKGRMWIGTRGAGLDRLEEGRPGFQHYRHDPRNPRSLGHEDVWDLAEDAEGNLWIATHGGGLDVWDAETETFRHHRHDPRNPRSLRTDKLTCLHFDPEGTLWIGTDGGDIQQMSRTGGVFTGLPRDATDPGAKARATIRSMYEDRRGRLWLGTFSGGAVLLTKPDKPFGYMRHDADDALSLSDDPVASVLEDREGRIWIGTEGGYLNQYDPQARTFRRHRFDPNAVSGPALLCLLQDRRGQIWVGTYSDGLARFDPDKGSFTPARFQGPLASEPTMREIWALAEDPDTGDLLLGTSGGLLRANPATGKLERFESTAPAEQKPAPVRALHWDRGGNLWIATFAGLQFRARGARTLTEHRHDEQASGSLSHDWVTSVHEDAQGRIWLGTYGGGLDRLDPATGTFTVYKESDGLASDVVYGVEEDATGRLWASTNRGVSRLDPATGRIENFDLTNGLRSMAFHMGASGRTRAGRILFGSQNGLYDFDPEKIVPDPRTPPVVMTGLRVFNEPVTLPGALPTLDQVVLSHRDNVFSVEFAALDFNVPRRNLYAYRLEGFNNRWIQTGEQRNVTFTNLDPGRYVLHIKASNSDGVWNEQGAKLRIVIQPPFWKTAWFRTFAMLGAAFGLIGLHRLRVRQLKANERLLSAHVEEALAKVRVLKGLIPVCAWCRKARDDEGYWSQLEAYVHKHTEADFSHGICPECAEKMLEKRPPRPEPR